MILASLVGTVACATSMCAPQIVQKRTVGDHEVKLRVEGVRNIDVIAIGAPHAFGIILPTMKGYGYRVKLTVDDRDEVIVYAATTAPGSKSTFTEMPTAEALDMVGERIEITASQDGKHIGFRGGPGEPWKALHMLETGVPFDSNQSGALGSGDAKSLEWKRLDSPAKIAKTHITDADHGYSKSYDLLWKAVAAQPDESEWTQVVLGVWPDADPAHGILLDRVKTCPRCVREDILDKALMVIRESEQDHVSLGVEMIEKSMDEKYSSEMDDALLARWPEAYIDDIVLERLKKSNLIHKKVEPTAAFKKKAVAKAKTMMNEGRFTTDAAELIIEAGSDADVAATLEKLLEQWPMSDGAHRLIMDNLDRAPDPFLDALEKKALENVEHENPYARERTTMALSSVKAARTAEK